MKMKAALESEQTSLHLHSWIDHIFGVSRKDKQIKNTFTDICYADSQIVQTHIQNRLSRLQFNHKNLETYFKKDCHLSPGIKMKFQALDLQLGQFGRVPKSIFSFPHPKKKIKSMKNKESNLISKGNIDIMGISPLDFKSDLSSSDLHTKTEIKSESAFEDFDMLIKMKH